MAERNRSLQGGQAAPTWNLSRPATLALLATALTQLAELVGLLSDGLSIASQSVPLAMFPAVTALMLLPRPRGLGSWRTTAAGAMVIVITIVAILKFPPAATPSLARVLVSAVVNGLLFQLALPLVFVLLFKRFGMMGRWPVVVACFAAAPFHALVPDHTAVYNGAVTPTVFLNLTLLTSYVVWRGCTLWPAIAAQISFDLFALEANMGIVRLSDRSILLAVMLVSMVLFAGERARTGSTLDAPDLDTPDLDAPDPAGVIDLGVAVDPVVAVDPNTAVVIDLRDTPVRQPTGS